MEPWSNGIRNCVWRINLFIYNLFISEIHSPFSKKSEDDLYVTGY